MILPHLKITTRLFAGFGALVVLGAAVAVYAVVQLSGVRAEVDRMQSLATNVQHVLESSRLLEVQRRAEFEYSIGADPKILNDSREAQGKTLQLLAEAAANATSAGQRLALGAIAEALRAHEQTVKTFVDLTDQVVVEKQKLVSDSENLVVATSKIADQARSSNDIALWNAAGDVERSILLVRVSQWRNSATTEKKGMMNFRRAADTAIAAVNSLDRIASDELKKRIPPLRAALDTYVETFNRSFAGRLTMSSLINDEMRPQIASILQQLQAVSEPIKSEFAASAQYGDATLSQTSLIQEVLALLVLLVGVTLAILIGRSIAGPIGRMTEAMRRLAHGDLTAEVPGLARKDEVGSMAQAVNIFKANGLKVKTAETEAIALRRDAESERIRNESEKTREAAQDQAAVLAMTAGLEALADGNLSYQIVQQLSPKTQRLKDNFNATAARLRDTLTTVAAAIASMRTGTGEIGRSADDLSKRTEQQAANLKQTAAALHTITATVRKTAQSVIQARQVVETAKTAAESSGDVVRRAVDAMNGIEKSSVQISQIIGVINEIALQTNLLALNAGVEAARAGDAGLGFAVVAAEVRALAQRSSDAAQEIKTLIFSSTAQVEQGVDLVGATGKALWSIVAQVTEINGIVGEIAASAQDQATSLDQVNTAIKEMDQITQQNAAMVAQSTEASHALWHETDDLSRLISQFRVGGDADGLAARPERRPGRPARPEPVMRVVGRRGVAA